RVILGAAGCVGKVPTWTGDPNATVEELNSSLAKLRNIDLRISNAEEVRFADVFARMLEAGMVARDKFGDDFAIAGNDGVHPGWAGHVVMAYTFLNSMGVDGEIGVFEVDMDTGKVGASEGHELISYKDNTLRIKSHRYPFCATGELDDDNSLRAGMALVPFNERLNRLVLKVRNGEAEEYEVVWGEHSHIYSSTQLSTGVNLADDFPENPFTAAFRKVDEAVGEKQAYETRQIKTLFHGPEGRIQSEATAVLTESVRKRYVENIEKAFVPVTHSIKIRAR
ncbi:MAG: hypothetical protein K9N48_08230, partial [Verrucomicrobia bacterium]|nr:hypothetical protein [Verrucomicrobiota bacterium]